MTKAEYKVLYATIKAKAQPLLDEWDVLRKKMDQIDKDLEPITEEMMMAQHTFLGCFECSLAIEKCLGKKPCCMSPAPPPTDGKKINESYGVLRDESPACTIFVKGTPSKEGVRDEIASLIESLSKLGTVITLEPKDLKGKPDNGKTTESNGKKHRDH